MYMDTMRSARDGIDRVLNLPLQMSKMIALPLEYGELPERYGVPIPADYGDPSAGLEGRPELHEVRSFKLMESIEVLMC